MKITEEQIKNVANLAKLDLPENEISDLKTHLKYILEQVESLSDLDTDGAIETPFVRNTANVFREDETYSLIDRDALLKNAPLHENGCFSVPKIVD